MSELSSQSNRRRLNANKRRHPVTPTKGRFARFIRRAFFGAFILAILGGIAGWIIYSMAADRYQKWAQEFDLERINDLEKPSIIYDRNNEEIGRIYVENRSYVALDFVSPTMVNALIAQEDARFREHPGYDLLGMARAAKELFQAHGEANQGASTITQQLARNAYDLKERARARDERSFGRKIVEVYLSKRITERYSKDQVLEFYLNRVYLGSGFYGIRAASLGYFGKEPKDLTSRESASIAALIKNPNILSPLNRPEANIKWRNHVLDRMASEGYIKTDEAERLKKMPLGLNPKPLKRGVSHIYERIANQIREYLGEERVNAAGLKIYTTIDKRIQDATGKALKESLNAIEQRDGYKYSKASAYKPGGSDNPNYLEGAAMVIDNTTGAILAYHGGRDYSKRQYDAIELGSRPPGTAILPFLYSAAFENGYSPASKILDDAIDNRLTGIGGIEGILGEWGSESLKNRYEGEISLRTALSQSKIAASLRLGMELGSKPFIDKLDQFGIRKPIRESGTEVNPVYRPRIYVGTEPVSLKEMTLAYSAIPNGGTHPKNLYFLDRIEDETGYMLWESPQTLGNRQRVTSTDSSTAYQLHSLLQDSLKNGSARKISPLLPKNFKGAVKTGTTYDFSDNWLFGYTSHITCGVWIGFLEGKKPIYPNAFSADTCGNIIAESIKSSLKDFPDQEIPCPSTIEAVKICQDSGKRATNSCYDVDIEGHTSKYRRNTITEYMRRGDSSLPVCDIHGEEGVSLNMFASSAGPNIHTKILPVIPILPKKEILTGNDPYHTEQIKPSAPRNYDLMSTGEEEPAQAQEIDDNGEGATNDESSISLPLPQPIDLSPVNKL
ncbi:MAG: transglycosylase domain-containing protein [Akkermansia sp.]